MSRIRGASETLKGDAAPAPKTAETLGVFVPLAAFDAIFDQVKQQRWTDVTRTLVAWRNRPKMFARGR
jgi:hypothetical protein